MLVTRRKLTQTKELRRLPFGAEYFFPFPKISWVAETYLGHLNREEAYRLMTHSAIAQLAKKYRFHDLWRERDLPEYIRQTEESIEIMRRLEEHFPGNEMILAAQGGHRYLGSSAEEVQTELRVRKNEFCLGLFHVACLGMAGITGWDEYIFGSVCAGDETSAEWNAVPIINGYIKSRGNMVEVSRQGKSVSYHKFGCATAFFPEDFRV